MSEMRVRSLSSSQMDRLGQGWFLGIATLLGVLIVILYATSIGRYASPWMGDAARYIEAARSLLRGEPLLISGPDGPKPMSLWPPGYPVLGSAVAMAGLPVHEALLLVTQASVAACVPALMASCLALHDRWRKRLLIAGMFLAICGIAIRTADIANRFAFYAHTGPEVSRIITTGDVKGADPRLQLRQFFQAWERTPELANVVAQLNPACGLVTPIYDLLLAVYDVRSVPSERLQETAPVVLLDPATPPAIVSADWAKALPGSNGALQLVPLPNLPVGIHVYSNAPGLCFRKPARPA